MLSYGGKECGVWRVLRRQGCVPVLSMLRTGEMGFNDLRRGVSVSSNTLSSRLRELRDYKIVEAFGVPSGERIYKRYRLTPRGAELAGELEGMLEVIRRIAVGV